MKKCNSKTKSGGRCKRIVSMGKCHLHTKKLRGGVRLDYEPSNKIGLNVSIATKLIKKVLEASGMNIEGRRNFIDGYQGMIVVANKDGTMAGVEDTINNILTHYGRKKIRDKTKMNNLVRDVSDFISPVIQKQLKKDRDRAVNLATA